MSLRLVGFLLCWMLTAVASSEQLFVRNRPFKGAVNREAGKFWVELKPLAEALGLKVEGDDQQGYVVASEAETAAPGQGKVIVKGTEVETSSSNGSLLVSLDQVAALVGAKVIANKSMGTIDVNLVPVATAKPQTGAFDLGSAAYTLIEYGVPGQAVTQQIKPVVTSIRSEYKNVNYVFCNAWNDADLKRFSKYTQAKDATYPVVYLIDREGKVLFQLLGGHVIQDNLVKNMRKMVNVTRQ